MMEGEISCTLNTHTGEEILRRVKQQWLCRITIATTLSLNYLGFTSPRSLYCQIFFVWDRCCSATSSRPPDTHKKKQATRSVRRAARLKINLSCQQLDGRSAPDLYSPAVCLQARAHAREIVSLLYIFFFFFCISGVFFNTFGHPS